ncbi:MAG: hypothetical protein JRG81_00070 [Deltaproteobacteria bacterium]|nr:hypothetical protein [Deltaproteobacteria bacterium]MBW2363472.1 hypothetical protein [Deltaproteobacteria bacterium]
MKTISKEEMLKRIIALAQRQGLNRQKGGITGRRSRRLLSGDIDPRQLGVGLGLRRSRPEAEAIPDEAIPEAETVEAPTRPDRAVIDTNPQGEGRGPTSPDMPDSNPIQARMSRDYMNPELESFGKKIAGKGLLAAAGGAYLNAGLGGVVPAMMNPTYGAGYGLYKAVDAATDAQHRGKQLENVFSEQGFGFGDTYVQDQITQAQDYDEYSKDPDVMAAYTAPPSEHLDPGVLEAISHDPTWADKFGLSKRVRNQAEREGDADFNISDPWGPDNKHGPGTPGYEAAGIGIENEMAAIEAGVDVFGDRKSDRQADRQAAADVDPSEMSALGTDAEGVVDFDSRYGGYKDDGSWNVGGREDGPDTTAPGTQNLDDDFSGISADIDGSGGGESDAK